MSLGSDSRPQTGSSLQWQRLSLLRQRMEGNCDVLGRSRPALARQLREFVPAAEYSIAVQRDQILVAQLEGTTAHLRPVALGPRAARGVVAKICPTGSCTDPLLVAGLDQGWLWQFLLELPIHTPTAPGHRPALYFLVRQIEELWIVLHLHDWRTLLADGRVVLLAGEDAVQQFTQYLLDHPLVAWPRQAVSLDKQLWKDGVTLASVLGPLSLALAGQQGQLLAQYPRLYQWATPPALAAKIRSGARLRVLGITSLYTTFLQYSMRDWLAGFAQLGHETRLLIEQSPQEIMTSLGFALACVEFQPDLVLLIDHYRGALTGLPPQVPCAMWVQDHLPHIFSAAGGARQGPRDFCLGFGRLHLSSRYGYPARRYLPATMGLNEQRFGGEPPGDAELQPYRCDVSYVSHASTPADVLLQVELDRQDQRARMLLQEVFNRMVAHYQAGGPVFAETNLQPLVEQVARDLALSLPPETMQLVLSLLTQQINNALFRHQTLLWLADMGVNLHLYGRGWEKHPQLKQFAKGVADNQTELRRIYLASKINIQVTPFGAVHQRLLDGLAAGAFFLVRWHSGDVVGPFYQRLWDYCQYHQIHNDRDLHAVTDPEIRSAIAEINRLEGTPTGRRQMTVYDVMQAHVDEGFAGLAGSVWPEYDQVAFDSREELARKVSYYLANEAERRRIAASMRQRVIQRMSYASISQRLLDLIADEMAGNVESSPAVAPLARENQ